MQRTNLPKETKNKQKGGESYKDPFLLFYFYFILISFDLFKVPFLNLSSMLYYFFLSKINLTLIFLKLCKYFPPDNSRVTRHDI